MNSMEWFDETSMKDYHNHYLITDILLLADVFENFRKMSCQAPHWEIQIIIVLMISTCPDSSDGRALDM